MKNKIVFGIVSILIIIGAIVISVMLVQAKPEPKKDSKKENTMFVKTELGINKSLDSDMIYRGRITAFDNVSLASEVSGKLIQGDVRFKTGESFKKGDVIINIYNDDIKASLKSGKSSFLQTVSKILPDLKIDYKDEYQKWYNFFNAVDPEKPLPELPEIKSDKEKVFLASNNVLSSYYSLQQQQINLKRYTIIAPFTGSFKSVNKEIGAIASPSAELANIIRSDKLEIIVPVFPKDLTWLSIGEEVTINDDRGIVRNATVSRISGFVDQASQSVNVYLTYNATGSKYFLEGEYVNVIFNGVEVTGFEIPREALVDNFYVYELKNDKLHQRKIEIVRTLEDSFIVSGIDSTMTIVTESLASVSPNIKYLAR